MNVDVDFLLAREKRLQELKAKANGTEESWAHLGTRIIGFVLIALATYGSDSKLFFAVMGAALIQSTFNSKMNDRLTAFMELTKIEQQTEDRPENRNPKTEN